MGYHFGQAQGRKQLEQLRRHVVQRGKRPEVKQWQERGWDIAYERALAAKRLASTTTARGKKTGDPAAASATSVADDTERRSRFSTSPTLADPTSDRPARSRGAGATSTGFGGRTVAEDSEAVLRIVAACPKRDRHDPGNRRHTPRRPISGAVSRIRADPPFSGTNRDSPHEAAPGRRCGQV